MPPDAQPQATSTAGQPSWMAPVTPVIPDHELVRRIGGGSYGDVWLARTTVGTWRAVKVVFRDRFTDARPYEREFSGMQKFEPLSRGNEAFVDILQIGRNDAEGYFYYVMELADDAGRAVGKTGSQEDGPLTADTSSSSSRTSASPLSSATYVPRTLSKVLLERGRLPVGECVELGLALNLGLAQLHRAGLIHRDIKPSNIIFVGGVPKLADIGLVIDVAEARSFVGTEGFIPPEGPNSPQADLYSLGKVLYEAGMGKDRKDFPEPFTQLAEAPDSPQLLEFNAILLKACAANREERYQSAEEMNADLALLQSGGSVRQQRKVARQLRFVQRAGALVTALAAVIALGWWWQSRQTAKVRELASENLTLAEQANASAALARKNEATARESLYAADINVAHQALQAGNLRFARALLQNHLPQPGQPDLRGFEWRYLWHQCRSEELFSLSSHTNASRVLALAPNGRLLAVGGHEGGHVRLLDLTARQVVATLADTNLILSLAFAPDGGALASGSINDVRLYDPRSFREVRRLTNAAAPAVYSPDGRFLLTGRGARAPNSKPWSDPQEILVWDTATWAATHTATFSPSGIPSNSRDLYLQLAFGAASDRLVALNGDTVRLLSCPDLKELAVLPEQLPESFTARPFLALAPDNRTLAIPSPKGYGVRLWDLAEQRELRVLPGHADHIFSARFSPDGATLATASPDQTVKLWRVATGDLLHTFRGQADEVVDLAFAPDGTWLASLGITESQVMVWDTRRPPRLEAMRLWPQGFDPGGNLVVLEENSSVLLNPADLVASPFPTPRWTSATDYANKLNSVSADGRYQAIWLYHEKLSEIWDRRLGTRLCAVPNFSPDISFDPRRGRVTTAVTNASGQVDLAAWQLPAGTLKWQVPGFAECGLTATATGDYVVNRQETNFLVSRVVGDALESVLAVSAVSGVAISPDGKLLATAAGDITLRTLPEGRIVGVLKGHTRKTVRLAFHPDGRTLASIADDHTARLWHLATHRELLRFPAPCDDNDPFQLEFSPDGRVFACYRHDGKNALTSLYFAPTLAEIAAAEGGDYRALAGENGPTWLAVSQEFLRGGKVADAWTACVRADELAATRDEVGWWLQPQIQRHRVEVLRRLGRWDEAGRENCRLHDISARDPATPAGAIDLSAAYNVTFAWNGLVAKDSNDLRELPVGLQNFGGTMFDVRGAIVTSGRSHEDRFETEPTRVDGIRLARKVRRLHFLQMASGDSRFIRTGDRIGYYRLHYADGRIMELPLRYNVDLSDYWELDHLPRELPAATVAWRGQNPKSRAGGEFIRLFRRTWENPRPDVEVTHLDLVAELPRTHPWLIALTAE